MKVQGQTVLSGLNVLREAGAPNRAVVKDLTVKATGTIELELQAVTGSTAPPIVAAMSVTDAAAPPAP